MFLIHFNQISGLIKKVNKILLPNDGNLITTLLNIVNNSNKRVNIFCAINIKSRHKMFNLFISTNKRTLINFHMHNCGTQFNYLIETINRNYVELWIQTPFTLIADLFYVLIIYVKSTVLNLRNTYFANSVQVYYFQITVNSTCSFPGKIKIKLYEIIN